MLRANPPRSGMSAASACSNWPRQRNAGSVIATRRTLPAVVTIGTIFTTVRSAITDSVTTRVGVCNLIRRRLAKPKTSKQRQQEE